MESWIEAHIYVEKEPYKFLVKFLKPLIQELRSKYEIQSYHFLYEPELMFRVLTNKENVKAIKDLIDKAKNLPQIEKDVEYIDFDLNGHLRNFGEDGWKTTCKFLEAGSDFVLDSIDPTVKKGSYFSLRPLTHYFFNQTGLNTLQEAIFHIGLSNERVLTFTKENFKQMNSRLKKVEDRIRKLE